MRERAGTFAPLRFLPHDKVVVLGLITTKVGELEPEEILLRRMEEASKYVPVDQLAVSPQCGFASVSEGNLLTFDDQRRKLELINRVAAPGLGRCFRLRMADVGCWTALLPWLACRCRLIRES